MKIKEELSIQKNEYESLNEKLAELTDEDLAQVSGGAYSPDTIQGDQYIDIHYTPEGPMEFGHQYG